ncbi:MAG: LptF/LptG family permease [Sediminispirochaetaceae bacterium]
MRTLHGMLLKSFFPIFLIALLFFILTLEMVDLFSNLIRYLNNDASVSQILLVSLFYLPKCATFSTPPALMFAIAFSLGNLYARNELISILGAGISFRRLIVPLLVIGILFSFGYFFFHEQVVIDTYSRKNSLSQSLLGQKVSYSNTNITVLGSDNRNVYHADYYNDASRTLSGLTVVKRDGHGRFISRLESEWAQYSEETGWTLYNVSRFERQLEDQSTGESGTGSPTDGLSDGLLERSAAAIEIDSSFISQFSDPSMAVLPINFQRKTRNIDELKYHEAREWIQTLRKTGRVGYRSSLTDYYKRFSFAFTPFIVVLISASIGSRFKKNILLMSLLVSLIISVLYYVGDMILGLFAKQGIIEPASGAWGAVIIFTFIGALLLKLAKT